jgi:hypothetical protein
LQARLAAIPKLPHSRCYFLELPIEVREQILEYSIYWTDLACLPGLNCKTSFDDWKDRPLQELPFWIKNSPTVLCLNKQILCETITMLLRNPLMLAPDAGYPPPMGIKWANKTVLWPMARLLKLYGMASGGEKLRILPKVIILEPDTEGRQLWLPLHQLLQLWKRELEFDTLRVDIRHKTCDPRLLINGADNNEAAQPLVELPQSMTISSFTWAR